MIRAVKSYNRSLKNKGCKDQSIGTGLKLRLNSYGDKMEFAQV